MYSWKMETRDFASQYMTGTFLQLARKCLARVIQYMSTTYGINGGPQCGSERGKPGVSEQ